MFCLALKKKNLIYFYNMDRGVLVKWNNKNVFFPKFKMFLSYMQQATDLSNCETWWNHLIFLRQFFPFCYHRVLKLMATKSQTYRTTHFLHLIWQKLENNPHSASSFFHETIVYFVMLFSFKQRLGCFLSLLTWLNYSFSLSLIGASVIVAVLEDHQHNESWLNVRIDGRSYSVHTRNTDIVPLRK